jgi:hypothetical protein
MSVRGGLLPAETRDGAVLPIILEMTKAGKSPQPQPDFTVNYRQKCYQPLLLLQKGRVGALLHSAEGSWNFKKVAAVLAARMAFRRAFRGLQLAAAGPFWGGGNGGR